MSAYKHKILLVEDDKRLVEMLSAHFEAQGWETLSTSSALEVSEKYKCFSPDLIILDRNLPDGNGIDICQKIRKKALKTKILMLTGYSEELDIVVGLESGADDYVAKPFRLSELIARIKALLRRNNIEDNISNNSNTQNQSSEIIIDEDSRKVQVRSKEIELTAREFDLLLYLARRSGKVCSRSQILMNVWDSDTDVYEQSVNTIIKRLRSKIENDSVKPSFLETVRGIGYRFNGDSTRIK